MASKAFRVAVATEKIEFDLQWTDRHGEQRSRTFRCRPSVPVGVILNFATAMVVDEKDSGVNAMKLVGDLFKAAIVDEDYPAFLAILDAPDVGVSVEVYTDIASWLTEQYTARPTAASLPSTSQVGSSGTGSTVGASPVVLTYSRLEPVEPSLSSSTG